MGILQRVRADLLGVDDPVPMPKGDDEELLRLDSNENPYDFLGGAVPGINHFPSVRPQRLYAALAANYSVQEDQLLVTRGGRDGIDLLMRVFCQPGRDEVLLVAPTRRAYYACAQRNGVLVQEHETRAEGEFQPRVTALLSSISDRTRIIVIGSPNDPTGQCIPLQTIERIAHSTQDRCLLVIDESFLEFSAAPSAASLVSAHENLVVVRSMSYAWAIAGAGCGALLGNPDVVAFLARLAPSAGVATPVVNVVTQALAEKDLVGRLEVLEIEKNWLVRQLEGLPVVDRCFPSKANFLLLRLHRFAAACQAMDDAGIRVGKVSDQPGLERCVRVSIGLRQQHDALLAALHSVAVK